MAEKTITITRAGIVQMPWGDRGFYVNSDDIMQEIDVKINEMKPKRDYNGNFAARVTISVELLGDTEADNG